MKRFIIYLFILFSCAYAYGQAGSFLHELPTISDVDSLDYVLIEDRDDSTYAKKATVDSLKSFVNRNPEITGEISVIPWVSDLGFSALDYDTVGWAGGGLSYYDGQSYTINSGSTGNMGSKTWIYFDKNVSTTELQFTTTSTSAVGLGKTLIAIASVSPIGVKAQYVVLNDYNVGATVSLTNLLFTPIESDSVIASINASTEGITIDADNIEINGSTTFSSGYDPTSKVASSGGQYNSAASGARVRIFPDANTGIQIIDDSSNDVFKALVGGTDVGDVTIGDYSGYNGIQYDKSAGTLNVLGSFRAGPSSGPQIYMDRTYGYLDLLDTSLTTNIRIDDSFTGLDTRPGIVLAKSGGGFLAIADTTYGAVAYATEYSKLSENNLSIYSNGSGSILYAQRNGNYTGAMVAADARGTGNVAFFQAQNGASGYVYYVVGRQDDGGILQMKDQSGTVLASIGEASINSGAANGVWSYGGYECNLGTYISEFSIDGTLAGNSDHAVPTEKAVKTYVDTHAISDHGALTGLADDDHTNYLNNARHDLTARHTLGTVVPHDDHGNLSGLTDDDHTQYLNTTRHDLTARHTLGTVVPHDTVNGLSDATITSVANHDVLAYSTGLGYWANLSAAEAGLAVTGHTHTSSDITDGASGTITYVVATGTNPGTSNPGYQTKTITVVNGIITAIGTSGTWHDE